ncbi:MAG TPA: PqiC family protein [Syntrophales bacterium]|nr:PqiC family protein [Syntrophales bacterium]HQA82491.1 PqiC family protein [Syntrophales bacterium]
MMKRLAHLIICCVIAVVVSGCASSTPSRFYTLNSTTVSVPAVMPQAGYSVSVGPVSVPDAVDRPQIVVRTGPNQVSVGEFDRWASPLKNSIGHVVVENLVSMLESAQVTLFPRSTAAGASYRVVIDILRFESELGKAATLDVLWTVSSSKNGQSRRGHTTLVEPAQGAGYADLAAAHSRALGQLSFEIAGTIRGFEALQP